MTTGSSFGGFQTVRAAPVLSGWWRRVFAYLVDWFVVTLVGTAIIIHGGPDENGLPPARYLLLAVAVSVLYYVVGHGSRSGQTIGKKMLGIAVSSRLGQPIGYGRSLGRFLASFLVGCIPFVGLFSVLRPLWDERRRTLHDSWAKTIVIRVR
jgi:uncharacterized RDD family membrane protein YckC